MKLFLEFLRTKQQAIVCFIVCAALFFGSFWLYGLPVAAVVYPAILCLIVCVIFLIAGFIRVRRRHAELSGLMREPISLPDELPQALGIETRDYQRILALLAEERTAQARRAASEYAEMLDYYTVWAHQIKTPIAAMRLHLQGEDTASSRQLLLELGRIEQYADMVLTYLRLDSSSSDYVIRECDLDSVVRPAVRKFAGEFIDRKLRLHYEPLNIRVLTDEKWLGFVIEQLLSNALKYTPEGSITVSMEAGQTLCIRDTGIGIAPEDLPRIFERGYTGYNGRSDRRATGIGLYLCYRICRNLHHTIRVESEVGRGTAVYVGLARDKLVVE